MHQEKFRTKNIFVMMGFVLLFGLQAFADETTPAPSTEPFDTILRNTHYYVALERDYPLAPKDAILRHLNGSIIAEVSSVYKRAVDIEGTGRLVDGRLFNFARKIDGEIRYIISRTPYGLGVGSCELKPFRSIAVDRTVVPLGSRVFIQETVGMRLPSGEIHDGYWIAEDVGGGIKHDRLDFFVGDGDRGDVLRAHGIRNLMNLHARVYPPTEPYPCLHRSIENLEE